MLTIPGKGTKSCTAVARGKNAGWSAAELVDYAKNTLGIPLKSKATKEEVCRAIFEKLSELEGSKPATKVETKEKPKVEAPPEKLPKTPSRSMTPPPEVRAPERQKSPERKRPLSPKGVPTLEKTYPKLVDGKECEILSHVYWTPEEIKAKKKSIHDILLTSFGHASGASGSAAPSALGGKKEVPITGKLVDDMFKLYDKEFFGGQILESAKAKNYRLEFDLGSSTKVAGYCKPRPKECVIRIEVSGPIVQGLFTRNPETGETPRTHYSGGLVCYDKVECVQHVLEHEMIHAFIDLFCPQVMHRKPGRAKRPPQHPRLFKDMVYSLFLQTEVTHSLLLGEGSALEEKSKKSKDLRPYLRKGTPVIIIPTNELKDREGRVTAKKGEKVEALLVTQPQRGKKSVSMLIRGLRYRIPYEWIDSIVGFTLPEKKEAKVETEKKELPPPPESGFSIEEIKNQISMGSRVIIKFPRSDEIAGKLYAAGERVEGVVSGKKGSIRVRITLPGGANPGIPYGWIEQVLPGREEVSKTPRKPKTPRTEESESEGSGEGEAESEESGVGSPVPSNEIPGIRKKIKKGSKVAISSPTEFKDRAGNVLIPMGGEAVVTIAAPPRAGTTNISMTFPNGATGRLPYAWIKRVVTP